MPNTYFDTAKIIAAATAVSVSTTGTSNVGQNSSDLDGSLDDLGGNSSVDVSFEYRKTGASSWNQTSPTTLSSTGSYTQTVSNLNAGTDYEFRAFGEGNDSGETTTGSTLTFTTDSAIQIIDDFEDGNLSEYNFLKSGSTTITASTDRAWEGSYGLKMVGNADFGHKGSTSGLNAYPQAGDTVEWYCNGDTDAAHVIFLFGYQDGNNYYRASTVWTNPNSGVVNDLIQLAKVQNGSFIELALNDPIAISKDKWYRNELDWKANGDMVYELYDPTDGSLVASVSTNDTTWSSGGVGWATNDSNDKNDGSYADYARII